MAVSAPDATTTMADSDAGNRKNPGAGSSYQPPTFQIICLACEISSYAPDGDDRPLF